MDLSLKMVTEIPLLIKYHHTGGTINWGMGRWVTAIHFMAVYGAVQVSEVKKETLLLAFLLWPIR